DMLFCSDPKYVAVDLQYGPDGAVYIIDWYDQQHCHNPNTERWDRSNGRIYRMEWEATYKPVKVDLRSKSDAELVDLLSHKNQWFVRMARKLLDERAAEGKQFDDPVKQKVRAIVSEESNSLQRLQGLWAARAMGLISDELLMHALSDGDEYVRAW